MTLSAGERLGRFEIVEPLGAGGMGEVYRARDGQLDREVAIKVLPEAVAQDADRLERFEREARAVARLSHPNIVAIHDFGRDGEASFIVTELLEGQSLRRAIPPGGMSWQRAAGIAAAVADGLAAAHSRGVIHRDVKPDNLFLTDDGRVKILDFGLAQQRQQPALDAATETHTPAGTVPGTVMGTAGYMSPEQLRGEAADGRSDIFALGCVLYEMLTGQRPFTRGSDAETTAAILKEDPPPIAASGTAVPAELEHTVRRCLEKSLGARFQSASDLAYSLRSMITDNAVPIVRPVGGATPPIRSRRRVLWAAVAAVVVIGGFALWAPWETRPETTPDSRADSEWVAVAPFENRTGDPTLNPLGERMVDLITQRFSKIGRSAEVLTMDTVPYPPGGSGRPAPSPFPGSSPPITPKGPHMLVSGSYYVEGDKLVFQARLTDYDSGELVFAFNSLRAPRSNPAIALGELRERVVAAVVAHWYRNLDIRLMNPPSSYDALAAFARAYEEWGIDMNETVAENQKAVDLDPDFHAARLSLIISYANVGDRDKYNEQLAVAESQFGDFTLWERIRFKYCKVKGQPAETTQEQLLKLQRQLVSIAPHLKAHQWNLFTRTFAMNRPRETLEILDPMLPTYLPDTNPNAWAFLNTATEAHHALGEYEKELGWANIGIEKFPDVGNFYVAKARALAAMGQTDSALGVITACDRIELRSDSRLTATNPGLVMLIVGVELRIHGHPQQADELLERAVNWYERQAAMVNVADRDPDEIFNHSSALRAAHRWAEAKELLLELEHREYSQVWANGALGVVAAEMGDIDEARRRFDALGPNARDYALYWRACIAARLDKDQAVELMRDYFAQGLAYTIELHWDVDLEPLWDYPPYQELIAPKG